MMTVSLRLLGGLWVRDGDRDGEGEGAWREGEMWRERSLVLDTSMTSLLE